MRAVIFLCSIAAVCFFLMFCPLTKSHVPFWPMMVGTTALLGVSSLIVGRKELKEIYAFKLWHIPVGIISAAALYLVFWIGHFLAIRILPFADSQVNSIYDIRAAQNPWVILTLLFCIIGPAEEIFWRGFVQYRLSNRWGAAPWFQGSVTAFQLAAIWFRGAVMGFLVAAALYTFVHLPSMNLMLVAASALCGGFWGLLFAMTRSLWPCIISHALWDITIFIIFPII